MIAEINRVKSVNQNQTNAQTVRQREFRKGFNPEDITPLKNLLGEIVKSPLDDGKKETLQSTFRDVLLRDVKPL